MIKATEDKVLKGNIDLILDNLFDIFKVKAEDNFKSALVREIFHELDSMFYHRNCQIT